MSISNVPSLLLKIRKGAEGGHEFARLCKTLLASCYHGRLSVLELADDSMGDFKKCDARLRLIEYEKSSEEVILFQFKFYPSPLSSKHKHSIKKSYIEAANENPSVGKWIIITPEDLNKLDSQWLSQVVEDSRIKLERPDDAPQIEHWGHTKLLTLLLKYKDIGIRYYPELFGFNGGFATIDNISVDQNLCTWEMSEDDFTVFAKEIDLERFYDYNADLVSFANLPEEDSDMFKVAAKVIKSGSSGKSSITPEVLYKGLISKILMSYDEKKLELYKKDIEISEDSLRRWWIKPEESNNNLSINDNIEIQHLKKFHDLFGKSTDPILNITFANRSNELVVVYNIGFKIIDMWQELGGPPTYASVVPILADVVFEISENRKKWLETFEQAIQVPPNQAMTIKVRLKDYLDTYGVTYMVSGVFEFGISSDNKVKSPTILFAS